MNIGQLHQQHQAARLAEMYGIKPQQAQSTEEGDKTIEKAEGAEKGAADAEGTEEGGESKDDADRIEKGGEGSKGGHVIGHTKSGKPIYEEKMRHPEYSGQDHFDAADHHLEAAKKIEHEHPYIGIGPQPGKEEHAEKFRHHIHMSEHHEKQGRTKNTKSGAGNKERDEEQLRRRLADWAAQHK